MARRRTAAAASLLLLGGCYLSHGRTEREEPPPSDCPAALLAGAPVPMPGYCPTRVNRSAYTSPSATPELSWSLEVPGAPGVSAPIVVGPGGRIYLTDGGRLIAIDDRGSHAAVAWTTDLESRIGAPVLLADGSIFVVARADAERREGIWLRDDGTIRARAALPPHLWDGPFVGSTGALFFRATPEPESVAIVALDESGAMRWSRPLGRGYLDWAVGPDDRIVVNLSVVTDDMSEGREGYYRIEAWLVVLDGESGDDASRVLLDDDSLFSHAPVVGPDGAIYTIVWTDDFAATALVVIEPDGTERFRAELDESPWAGLSPSISVAADGTAYVKDGRFTFAIGAGGERLWQRDAHPNIEIGGTIDADGRILVGHSAIDPLDGSELWVSEIPVYTEITPDGTTFYFGGVPVVGDDVLYYMAHDSHLYAAAAP